MIGETTANAVKAKSLEVYDYASKYALERGIIIADTKFEFGMYGEQLILIDEVLTPDSSRFWDINLYKVGQAQPSYDKQPLRDWLVKIGWNKEPPAPNLPPEVIAETQKRYETAFKRLTGQKIK
jgi:phosphoribosylaminoimidazole-succinocarboxamide synthase